MRSNVVSEAGVSTRINQWWGGIPFITASVVVVCSVIYLVCLLVGYDSFQEVCFLPVKVTSGFQVYRIYTAVLFHGSLVHVLFNMLALVPLGSDLERIMGSIRLLYLMLLLAATNAIFHIFIALVVAYNPLYPYQSLMHECAIGFSGILFSMMVIETSLSGDQARSIFGLFNVPAKLYPWILLILIQLVASNVSLLGHLCGILSGFACLYHAVLLLVVTKVSMILMEAFALADTYGLFNYLLPGPSFYAAIENSSFLSACLRRPGFILCTGGTTYGPLPIHSNANTGSGSGLVSRNLLNNISSWMPQRQIAAEQPDQDSRFPGRGRTLGSLQTHSAPRDIPDSNLEVRLLDDSRSEFSSAATISSGQRMVGSGAPAVPLQNPVSDNFDEELKKLVSMGFEKTQAEVALAAADGDPSVAVEILMSQQK